MHITLVDQSIPFDGLSAATRPLGGAEKAFAALAVALARRGHTVRAFNATPYGTDIDGVRWDPLDARKPPRTDVLIAFRQPALLDFIRLADRRVLWITGPGRLLERAPARAALDSFAPLLLLTSEAQTAGFERRGRTAGLLPPAVAESYRSAEPSPVQPPYAIVTAHPAHGLDGILDLWQSRIHPAAPQAELVLCSTILARAEAGDEAEGALRPVIDRALAARDQGVRIVRPQADPGMAALFAGASVHLHPGHADDMGCFTLMESQACGCPAVVRPLGAAGERVANGVSAYVVPDDDSFANLALLLLTDRALQGVLSREAKGLYRTRSWDNAAMVLEGWIS
ncbi:glycosyltransferase [Magnetospirillum molischianum]|uniref:Glycosyltransferase n=1 Tax=Magnetospirillum molischianum DSM 120 TaxID=1150626 RepID=H8FQ64_MAGML|nr:glycosyltransferase [Magnetospirillum molischianum]CCG40502.1 Glycosyltransferase [Magnetospirillum molischianum DSM 120]